jgi:hypothetical protein
MYISWYRQLFGIAFLSRIGSLSVEPRIVEEWRLLGCYTVITDVSEELSASIILSSPILVNLMIQARSSFETSVLT